MGNRILFVSTFYGRKLGGAEISLKLLFDGLNKTDQCTVSLVTSQLSTQDGFFSLNLEWIPKKAFLFGNYFIDKYASYRLAKIAREFQPHILHVQDLFLLPATVLLSQKIDIPVVVTVRDNLPREYKILGFNVLERRNHAYYKALMLSQKIIAISAHIKENLIRFGIPESKIKVIYNIPSHFPTIIPEASKDKKNFEIMSVGRFYYEKGFHVLIKAFQKISVKNSNVVLKLVGAGPEDKILKKLVKELGMEDRVIFCSWVNQEEIPEILAHADVIVIPSLYEEPLGRVALDSAMLGRAVVASSVGGLKEIIESGKSGILVKPNDPTELKNKIEYLMYNPEIREKMGATLKANVLKKFSSEKIISDTLNIYDAVLAR